MCKSSLDILGVMLILLRSQKQPKTDLPQQDEKVTREITFSNLSDFQPMVDDNVSEKSS